ncbi:Uncharacterised protein [Legionella pneumophila]|nr:Uncharacterised protein [Legionella pneumophila]CZJ28034.1 Uncharacterised protein [Legionella pneumophila]CZJ28099.1 Uncharacterised protein [Legionella pneumophila]CZJ28125.1 Uncharacterised protein [Legionella pneumophila]CZJ32652.1 Uncharacterised protein [Legionella pneumophila]
MFITCSELKSWIPFFSAFIGASIGFISSFSVAYYLQNKKDMQAHQDFMKQKLEELYITTISIGTEYNQIYQQALFHINKEDFKPGSIPTTWTKDTKEIAPLVRCEMLLNLYLPILREKFEHFTNLKEKFGTLFGTVIMTNYSHVQKKERQKITKTITDLYFEIDSSLKKIQKEISNITK